MNAARFALLPAIGLLVAAQMDARQEGVTPGGIAWDMRGTGPAVVLIHGSNLDRRLWDDVVGPLAVAHRVIRYDLRAHGRSADVTGTFSHVEDLAEVLDVVGVRRVALVGLSAGSTIAIDFALSHPDRVTALVLASPWPGGMHATERPAYSDDLVLRLRAGDIDGAAALLAEQPMFGARPERAALARRMVLENARLFHQDPTREQRLMPPAISRLSEVTAPTLVVVGDQDLKDIRRAADTLAASIHAARRVEMPGANHLLPLWDPDGFTTILLDFLRP